MVEVVSCTRAFHFQVIENFAFVLCIETSIKSLTRSFLSFQILLPLLLSLFIDARFPLLPHFIKLVKAATTAFFLSSCSSFSRFIDGFVCCCSHCCCWLMFDVRHHQQCLHSWRWNFSGVETWKNSRSLLTAFSRTLFNVVAARWNVLFYLTGVNRNSFSPSFISSPLRCIFNNVAHRRIFFSFDRTTSTVNVTTRTHTERLESSRSCRQKSFFDVLLICRRSIYSRTNSHVSMTPTWWVSTRTNMPRTQFEDPTESYSKSSRARDSLIKSSWRIERKRPLNSSMHVLLLNPSTFV